MSSRLIKDVIEQWPPSVWVQAGRSAPPNPSTAIVDSVRITGDSIILIVKQGGQSYLTSIKVNDEWDRERVFQVLSDASGKTIAEVGNLEL